MNRDDFTPAARLSNADGTPSKAIEATLFGDGNPDEAASVAGSGDPLDRGTGARTSGGGLTNADFVPAHGRGPVDPNALDENDDRGRSPLQAIKEAVGLSNPRGKELDDEMERPPEQRSPLT